MKVKDAIKQVLKLNFQKPDQIKNDRESDTSQYNQ